MSEITRTSSTAERQERGVERLAHRGRGPQLALGTLVLIVLGLMFLPSIQSGGHRRRPPCKNNLKQIGLALHNFHEKYGRFPPAYLADDDGRPMHSWRVLILPFIDQQTLYNEYRFDEPRDGPNNRKLRDQIVDVFRCPTDHPDRKSANATDTSYVAVVGPETMWPGSQPVRFSDVTDGMSSTLMVVEIANSGIHWMEPRDLHVRQMAPTINSKNGQGMSSKHEGGANGQLTDGSVRFFANDLPAETLKSLLTRNGGDNVGDF